MKEVCYRSKNMQTGYLITLEGGEGSGKSSLLTALADMFADHGHRVCRTREPGGTPIAERIRAILLDTNHGALTSDAELFLYAASRAEHCAHVIRPALLRGEIVLCDRFTDATLAYQGFGRALSHERIRTLNTWATNSLLPNLTLFLDCDVALGLSRAKARLGSLGTQASEGRFEAETVSFHERVREGYLAILRDEPNRVVRIDANQSAASVFTQAQTILRTRGVL